MGETRPPTGGNQNLFHRLFRRSDGRFIGELSLLAGICCKAALEAIRTGPPCDTLPYNSSTLSVVMFKNRYQESPHNGRHPHLTTPNVDNALGGGALTTVTGNWPDNAIGLSVRLY